MFVYVTFHWDSGEPKMVIFRSLLVDDCVTTGPGESPPPAVVLAASSAAGAIWNKN